MNYFNLILKNPFRNKTRSFLAIVGIAIGIATIVALGVITATLETSTEMTLKEGTAEITAMKVGSYSGSGNSLNESYVENLTKVNGVNRTTGVLETTLMNSETGSSTSDDSDFGISVNGVDSKNLDIMGISSVNGSVYSDTANEAIIGKTLAEEGNYTIGDNISIYGTDFKIVGTFETGSVMTDGSLYTGLDTIQNLTDSQDQVSSIAVKINTNATLDDVNNQIKDQYNNTLTTITTEEMVDTIDDTLGMINTATTAIEVLAIVIGGLGVINTMMMTVFERTREIGVLKSVGWTNRRVLSMIMGESIVITLLSGIIGTVVGLLAVVGMFAYMGGDMTLSYNVWIFAKAFGVALTVGIIGGLYPAIKASRLSPTESLRYE
ncbi:ABC transporter permease [Methanosphaera sp.]